MNLSLNTCTCYHSTGAQAIRPLMEQISSAQMERIRKNFPSAKPMNEEVLVISGNESEDTWNAGVNGNNDVNINTNANTPEDAVRKPIPAVINLGNVAAYHTGYARIDNAITDALRGKSQELKDSVYDIIRSDFLPNNVHGIEEADRLALISLGVEKAEYLAGQFMDEKTGASFMEAMRSIAAIGMEGTRVGSCEMKYNVKHAIAIDGNGSVHDDDMDEFLYSMERESPEDYAEYNRIRSSSDADGEAKVPGSYLTARRMMVSARA